MTHRNRQRLIVAAAAGAAVLLVGCGPSGSSPAAARPAAVAGTGSGSAGGIRVAGAYIPQQASPDVAAAYLDITNTGPVPDALISATSSAAPMVTMHDNVPAGAGESMVATGTVELPAHATVGFTVGHRHLMLMNPPRPLEQGQRVTLSLHFARAGTLILAVPIVGFTGPGAG